MLCEKSKLRVHVSVHNVKLLCNLDAEICTRCVTKRSDRLIGKKHARIASVRNQTHRHSRNSALFRFERLCTYVRGIDPCKLEKKELKSSVRL